MMLPSRATCLSIAAAALFSVLTPAVGLARDRHGDGAVVVFASGVRNDGVGAGTIVAIAGRMVRIVTAKHVATFGTPSLRFDDGTTANARIVELISGRDLAVLEAEVPAPLAATLHAAPLGRARSHASVHVWGSGLDGPALEPAALRAVGAALPDGPANGRYALTCPLCHEGDSGGGVFDESGELIGVFTGYFTLESDRIAIAEGLDAAVRVARDRPFATLAVADSTQLGPTTQR